MLLDVGLDSKLRAMIISLRTAGAWINQHVVRRVLIGLVQSYPEKFGKYINFEVTRSWVRSVYQRMKFSCITATTSRPVITHSLWNEIKSQFLHEVSQKVLLQNPFKICCDWWHNHSSQGTKAFFKSRFQWQKKCKYCLNSLWIIWWQNPTVPTNLQRKDTKISPERWFPWRFLLTLSRRRPLSYRNQSIDLRSN